MVGQGSGRSRTKHKCPLTDPVQRPLVKLFEVPAGHAVVFWGALKANHCLHDLCVTAYTYAAVRMPSAGQIRCPITSNRTRLFYPFSSFFPIPPGGCQARPGAATAQTPAVLGVMLMLTVWDATSKQTSHFLGYSHFYLIKMDSCQQRRDRVQCRAESQRLFPRGDSLTTIPVRPSHGRPSGGSSSNLRNNLSPGGRCGPRAVEAGLVGRTMKPS